MIDDQTQGILGIVLFFVVIVVAIICYRIVAKARNESKQREIERELERREAVASRLQQLLDAIEPHMIRLLKLYSQKHASPWPRRIVMPNADRDAFLALLNNEGIAIDGALVKHDPGYRTEPLRIMASMGVPYEAFERMPDSEHARLWLGTQIANRLFLQQLLHFAELFLSHHPGLIDAPRTNENVAEAYAALFGDDPRFMEFASSLVDNAHPMGGDQEVFERHVASVLRRRIDQRRAAQLAAAMSGASGLGIPVTAEDLDTLDGRAFEQFLGALFAEMGYRVELTKATGDQGADLIVERMGERTVVQAKRYSDTVGNAAVQQAVAAVRYYDAHHAIVATNSTFSPAAKDLAKANDVDLWDRERLVRLIELYM